MEHGDILMELNFGKKLKCMKMTIIFMKKKMLEYVIMTTSRN